MFWARVHAHHRYYASSSVLAANKSCYFADFSSAICLSSSVACDFSSSILRFFCCTRLLMRALHFMSSLGFCCSSVCCCCLAARDALYAALADLTLETILGVIGNFNTSIPAMQIASYNQAKVSQSNIPDYTNSLTFPWHCAFSLTFPGFQKFLKSGNPG